MLEFATTEELVEELGKRFEYFAITGVVHEGRTYQFWKFGDNNPDCLTGRVNILARSLELMVLQAEDQAEEKEDWGGDE